MTRVSALAVLFFAAMTLAVTNVNAQCSSCNQAAPVFAQAYSQLRLIFDRCDP